MHGKNDDIAEQHGGASFMLSRKLNLYYFIQAAGRMYLSYATYILNKEFLNSLMKRNKLTKINVYITENWKTIDPQDLNKHDGFSVNE